MKFVRTTALVVAGLALIAWASGRRSHRVTGSPFESSSTQKGNRVQPFGLEWAEGLGRDEAYLAGISGRVHSKAGKALSGAMACAFCAECDATDNGNDPVCAPPDASGHYVLRLSPGAYQVSLAATDHRPRVANPGGPIHLNRKDVELPDVELEEGGARVSGTVSDATGGPVAGATVQASFLFDDLPPGRYFSQVTKSDAAGAFSLTASEGHVLLLARASGYAADRVGTQAPARGIRLVVTPASRISGTVVTQGDQAPAAGLRVIAHGDRGFEQVATSDNDGAFTVDGLAPGTYSLDASGDGWIGRHSGTATVDISDAVEKVVISVVRGMRVTGAMRIGEAPCRSGAAYLTPAPGQPLPSLTAHADLSGKIVFEAVPPGGYQSTALCDGYGMTGGPDVHVTTANVEGLSWNYDKGADVTVRATTSEGKPVEGVVIILTPAPHGAPRPSRAPRARSTRTRADGVAHFLAISEGSYVLGGPDVESPTNVDVRASNDPGEFAVTVRPVGGIEVVVKDAHGQANDSVAVTATGKTDPFVGSGIGGSLGGGRYRIGPLAAGEYHVDIRDGVDPVLHADGADGAVQVRSGEVTHIAATYGGHSGRIAGRVVDGAGMPLENVWVSAEPSGTGTNDMSLVLSVLTQAKERRSLTDPEGRFTIDGLLETGAFSVIASHALGGEARIDGVAVGQNVELTLSTPGRLAGIVLTGGGRPATYFQIVVGSKENGQHMILEFGQDAQGKWAVDHVAPGAVEIRAQSPEGNATLSRVLAPAQRLEDIELRLQPPASSQN